MRTAIETMSSASNSLPRIGFALIFLSVIFVHLIRVSDTATEDDENWSNLHGNVPLTSGMWDYAWSIDSDEEKLKNISHQAHEKCFKVVPEVTWANVSIKELFFPDSPKFEPIKIDVLMYTVEGRQCLEQPDSPHYFFLTKGLHHNCVYYLQPMKVNNTRELQLTPDQVCGLTMPPAPESY